LLVKAGFVDSRPYRRIHDWYDNQSSYLKARYKDKPHKLEEIKALYNNLQTPVLHKGKDSSNYTSNPINKQTMNELVSETNKRMNEVGEKSASRPAPGGASAPLPERMTPEEMKAIRIKNMGDWK